MGVVIDIGTKEILHKDDELEFDSCRYLTVSANNLGVEMIDYPLEVSNIGLEAVEVRMMNQSIIMTRSDACEFFNVVKVFMDSRDRFMPKTDLISLKYEDEF